ncbi:hypothetical protein FHS89_001615 [Rubricella aquisinus]|uniref:Glycosyl transferase family 2 n=1 Tax=Rubricella aquisinus TaxID=2028108 RepID=A0A840WND4_9RHOB|nr:hypothetical protein [Rubricella aquisinus]MBB5515603.1 hypothetical protein [Rubricella aquisinus]
MSSLGIGVLTWRSPANLDRTLQSHEAGGLWPLVDQRLVFVQEGDADSVAVARNAGYEVATSRENLGIFGGFQALGRAMRTDLILPNENDFQIITSPETTASELAHARSLIDTGQADIVMLRSRKEPGEPFFQAKYHAFFPEGADTMTARLRRILRPFKARRMAARGIRLFEDAAQRAPFALQEIAPGWNMTTSRWQTWSNNPCLLRRDFFNDVIIAKADQTPTRRRINGHKNLEMELNSRWWRAQAFRIAQGPGIFSHDRVGYRGYD